MLYLSEAFRTLTVREGLQPDLVTGTSSGSILALYAATVGERPMDQHLLRFKDFILDIEDKDVWSWRRLGFAFDFVKWLSPKWLRKFFRWEHPGYGLVHFGPLRKTIESILDMDALRIAPFEIRLVAVDRFSGDTVLFSADKDPLTGTIASSAADLVDPIRYEGMQLMDGGLRHHSPWFVAYQEARLLWPDDELELVVISTSSPTIRPHPQDDWGPMFVRDISIAIHEIGDSDLVFPPLDKVVSIKVVRPAEPLGTSGHDMSNKPAIREAAERGGRDALHRLEVIL